MSKIIKIAVSAGHGLHTAGKRTPAGEREWSFNNLQATAFINELKNYNGVVTKLVSDPTGQRDVPLKERTDISNDWGADLYIAFHHNAYRGVWGSHTGTETFTYNRAWYRAWKQNNHSAEKRLAKAANDGIVKAYGLYNRGLKQANFHEVREPKADAILTEGGYMDSSIDVKVMRDDAKVRQSGVEVARKVADLYGLKRNSSTSNNNTSNAGTIYRVQIGSYSTLAAAANFAKQVEQKTKFDTYIVEANVNGKKRMRVQVGAFANKSNAENRLKELKKNYKDAFITSNNEHSQAVPDAEPQNEPTQTPQKSVATVAQEVLDGKWGNDPERKNKLEAAGYNPTQVQNRVNQLASSKPSAPAKQSVNVGSKVTLSSSASKYATGENIPSSVKGKSYTVQQKGTRNGKNQVLLKEIMSWVWETDVGGSAGTPSAPSPKPAAKAINVGTKVKLKSSASKYATGQNIPSSVKNKTYTVQQKRTRNGKAEVLLKEIVSWVFQSDVQ